MSPGERAALGRREPARPHYANTAPGFPPPYYPPYGMPHPNTWLGAPLISMAGRAPPPPRNTPVSKMAMHAQGAPLIIQNRHDRRKFTTTPEQRNHRPLGHMDNSTRDKCEPPEGNRPRNQQQQARTTRGGRNNNTDAVSVASDESSGSTNSETMLPRIIKPRKRRKKDRKPNNLVPHDLTATNLDLGDVDHCAVSGIGASHGIYEDTYCREMSLPYRLDVKVLEYPEPLPETYRVSALGEALEATRFGLTEAVSPAESAVSSCQCRLCDPVGQIWDAHSIANLLDENSSGDFAPTKLEDSMKVVGPLGRRGADTTLRRSWSDPSSRASERLGNNNNEMYSAPNLYSLFPPTRRASSPEPRSPLALEISSEIVTSINGHRDLEIKLFSTSPPATYSDRRSFFVDKSESAVNRCIIAGYDLKVNSAVNNNRAECSGNADGKKSEEVSDGVCSSAFGKGERPRNICDLALVSA
ncbi:hypothetical protein K1T71_006807 [Dendrolimus kikuchii]|uniref:Uncharacterized protein n=1 Tax=Dendrolimus kikuchii TaxID=765133 RepID=A0ACC1D1V1_9NEOP|nr:hypothetical protein K1T71_006807 [Dendrolimus kikuchii]